MIWFRRHIKTGSRLALFALAIQTMLVFGHVHQTHVLSLAQASSSYVSAPDDHSSRPDHHPPDEACAICALLAMDATALFSRPPILNLPHAFAFIHRIADVGFAHLDTARTVFNPRAPPVS